jgi:hypothetical protein
MLSDHLIDYILHFKFKGYSNFYIFPCSFLFDFGYEKCPSSYFDRNLKIKSKKNSRSAMLNADVWFLPNIKKNHFTVEVILNPSDTQVYLPFIYYDCDN